MSDWVPDGRQVAPELEPEFPHAVYTPEPSAREVMAGSKVMDRLEGATVAELFKMMHGIGEPQT